MYIYWYFLYLQSNAESSFLSRSPTVPDWTYDQILWTLGFSLILITAILGNTSVLWIITGGLTEWLIVPIISESHPLCLQLINVCGPSPTISSSIWRCLISWWQPSIWSLPSYLWETGEEVDWDCYFPTDLPFSLNSIETFLHRALIRNFIIWSHLKSDFCLSQVQPERRWIICMKHSTSRVFVRKWKF